MGVAAITAEKLVMLGANLEITPDARYAAVTVEKLVNIAKRSGSHITVHAGSLAALTLEKIASIGGNNVTIVI